MPSKPKQRWQDAYSVIEPQINADSVHVWPFAPEFPIDIRFLRFGPRGDIRMNRHDYFELLYVASGSVVYQVQDVTYNLHTGDLFVMGSTQLHRMQEYGPSGIRAAVLYFLPDALGGADSASEQAEYLMPFLVQQRGFPHILPASTGVPGQIHDLMVRMNGELPASTNRARLSVKTYLRMILILLVNHYASWRGSEAAFERQHRNIQRLQPLFDHIEARCAHPLTVEDAADLLHMSRSTFMRFFREVTGQSFVGYLNRFRVARAEALLADTSLSILEVSERVGFCDQSYFGYVFRSLLNVTPREYKLRVQSAREARA